jgi:glycosyltransferase involved in cell wall biosynthesis
MACGPSLQLCRGARSQFKLIHYLRVLLARSLARNQLEWMGNIFMKLLLATYNLPPDTYGGTEVYLESLTGELVRRGHSVELLASSTQQHRGPGRFNLQADTCWGLPAWRMSVDGSRFSMPEMYTTRCADLRAHWADWLPRHRPELLHVHGNTLAISVSLMQAATDLGIPIVFSLNNAPLLCPRGDFLTWRGLACDGRAELLKCMSCVTATRCGAGETGASPASRFLGAAAGAMMAAVTPLLSQWPVPETRDWSKLSSALHYPGLQRMRFDAQEEMLAIPTRWHAFSRFSRQSLMLNGVPPERIHLLRYPLPDSSQGSDLLPRVKGNGKLRLGFFGRFHKVKGIPVLLDAVRRLPDAPLQLEIYGQAQGSGEAAIEQQVRQAAATDSRVIWRGRIPHSEQPETLARLDALVVPSLWVETGPLTVLEAFAARVPVLGSDLSGINEWVEEGRNGWLFPPGNDTVLAEKIARLCANPSLLETARDFPPLDSTSTHATGVLEIYESALSAHAGQVALHEAGV